MKGIQWKTDKRKMASEMVRKAAAEGIGQFAEGVLTVANDRAPIEEGVLIGSGETDLDAKALKASIFYDTPYAARQHEDTRLRHDEGREAKWLENTIKEKGPQMGPFVAKHIKRVT